MNRNFVFMFGPVLLAIAGCQSSESEVPSTQASVIQSEQAQIEQASVSENSEASIQPAVASNTSTASCAFAVAGGPPPKPARGADFGQSVVRGTRKNVQRNLLSQIGARVGGGLGATVGGAIGNSTIRREGDVHGIWKITDGSPECGCSLKLNSGINSSGKAATTGTMKADSCQNSQIAQSTRWKLGYSFTGYDAAFTLMSRDNKTVYATLNRDGINYFSGALADGTPIVMWR